MTDTTTLGGVIPIPTISPRGGGHRFVWYGDCCSGKPGGSNEPNFAAVNAVFRRLDPWPDHVVMAGDDVMGSGDPDEHRRQWRYLLDHEMAWFAATDTPIYRVTSNHNTPNAAAEAVFREVTPEIPRNGPAGQEGLSYWVRRDDLLLVFVNTNSSGLGGSGHVEHAWLDTVLREQADAPRKIVVGHHPILPVNGYDFYPGWRVLPEEGDAFWEVLTRHDVFAYLCSHILLFDVQVREGVLQVCTGGAGTVGMALGLMPGPLEYLHLVQGALDTEGLRYQVLDTDGTAREWLSWPLPEPTGDAWTALSPETPPTAPASVGSPPAAGATWMLRLRLSGELGPDGGEQTLVSGWQGWEGPAAIRVTLEGNPTRIVVELVPEAGLGSQRWLGPAVDGTEPLDHEIAVHAGMGPGGVLWRGGGDSWSSMRSSSARGAERLRWPDGWAVGHGPSGPTDAPFHGTALSVEWSVETFTIGDLFVAT